MRCQFLAVLRRCVLAVLVAALPVAASDPENILEVAKAVSATAPRNLNPKAAGEAHPSRIIVRYRAGSAKGARENARNAARAVRVAHDFRIVPDLQLVEVPVGDVAIALDALRKDANVLYAEPDYTVYATAIPNDTDFPTLWGMNNVGQTVNSDPGVAGADVRAPQAWDFFTGDPNMLVGVLDTGVDYLHPDLVGNIWTNTAELNGLPDVDDDGNGYVDDIHGYDTLWDDGDPMDDHGHGTHVAGTIGAVANNGMGVAGVNWRCKIVAVKFLNAAGSGLVSDAIEGIQYLVDNGVRVSNHSWGGVTYSQALFDAFAAAQAAGHLAVAAAGNGTPFFGNPADTDIFPFYPSGYDLPNIVSVGATNNDEVRASFTNYGRSSVDVGAPGVFVYSTFLGGDYAFLSGTSMATPHVVGAVAMLMGRRPELSWQSVRDHIVRTARAEPSYDGLWSTSGVLNLVAAVADCNGNGIRDEFDSGSDCNANGVLDECEVFDCNSNGIPDDCDIAGASTDCNANAIPDECEPDCNSNGVADDCDISSGGWSDCNGNKIPDACEPEGNLDCNNNGTIDLCDIAGTSRDCNDNAIPDECDIATGTLTDADLNGLADECPPNFSLIPVGATGAHTIVGDRIFLPSGGQTVTLEMRMYDWSADTTNQRLVGYQGTLDASGFDNGQGSPLAFAAMPCDTSDDCRASFTRGVCLPTGLCTLHTASFIDTNRPDYVFFDLAALAGTFDYTEQLGTAGTGALVWEVVSEAVTDAGASKYGATIKIDVPPGAVGAHRLTFTTENDLSFWIAENGSSSVPSRFLPAFIILPSDCNNNGTEDYDDVVGGDSMDCNGNFIPDECEMDCNLNAIPDDCDITVGTSADCNGSGIPDECEVLDGSAVDCNGNGKPDDCDITSGASLDCTVNGIPDECERAPDCNGNASADANDICTGASVDCNANDVPDECDIASSVSTDCNTNGTPDECDLASGTSGDCNTNLLPDECDIADGTSNDCDANGAPDECQPDCNGNVIADSCDISSGTSLDLFPPGGDGIPDECQVDCNGDGIPDAMQPDCNGNQVPDDCDIADGTSDDCNSNGFPDECEPDCNANGVADGCDISSGVSLDDAGNGVPDECEIIIYVDASASGNNDGSSWANAFNELVDAFDAATVASDTSILVASGTYTPSRGFGNRSLSFETVDGLSVYGAFPPGGGRFSDRDTAVFQTTLSGDLLGDDSLSDGSSAENSWSIVHVGPDVLSSRLDGFLIRAAHNDNSVSLGGGAIRCDGRSTITNCTIEGNHANSSGSGILINGNWPNAHAIAVNCIFRDNYAGWGTIRTNTGSATLINCLIIGNRGAFHGGMDASLAAGDRLVVVNSAFVGNTATFINRDAGLYVSNGYNATIVNSIFWNNSLNGRFDEIVQLHIESGVADIRNSRVQGWTGQLGGSGNSGDDPLFVDMIGPDGLPGTADDNLRLQPQSTYIDAGDSAGLVEDFADLDLDGVFLENTSLDLAGRPREIDGLANGARTVDIGAYEFGQDCNGNLIDDRAEVASGISPDCNQNQLPDACELDCNGNAVPDDCDVLSGTSFDCNVNGSPDECDVAGGTLHDENGNGIFDECECFPSLTPSIGAVGETARYLSVVAGSPGRRHAIRVTMLDGPPPFDVLAGTQWWVGGPRAVSELSALDDNTLPTFQVAPLVCDPLVFNFGDLEAIHVYSEAIVPSGLYHIEAIDSQCDPSVAANYSQPLLLGTSRWGDVVGVFAPFAGSWFPPDGEVNISSDALAALDKFSGVGTAPAKASCDLGPAVPDHKINITEIVLIVDAFRGLSYPFVEMPAPCMP